METKKVGVWFPGGITLRSRSILLGIFLQSREILLMWINLNGGLSVVWKSYAALGGVSYCYFSFLVVKMYPTWMRDLIRYGKTTSLT